MPTNPIMLSLNESSVSTPFPKPLGKSNMSERTQVNAPSDKNNMVNPIVITDHQPQSLSTEERFPLLNVSCHRLGINVKYYSFKALVDISPSSLSVLIRRWVLSEKRRPVINTRISRALATNPSVQRHPPIRVEDELRSLFQPYFQTSSICTPDFIQHL